MGYPRTVILAVAALAFTTPVIGPSPVPTLSGRQGRSPRIPMERTAPCIVGDAKLDEAAGIPTGGAFDPRGEVIGWPDDRMPKRFRWAEVHLLSLASDHPLSDFADTQRIACGRQGLQVLIRCLPLRIDGNTQYGVSINSGNEVSSGLGWARSTLVRHVPAGTYDACRIWSPGTGKRNSINALLLQDGSWNWALVQEPAYLFRSASERPAGARPYDMD